MPKFCFVVVDPSGNTKAGSMEVANEEEGRTLLLANNLIIKNIWEPESINNEVEQVSSPASQYTKIESAVSQLTDVIKPAPEPAPIFHTKTNSEPEKQEMPLIKAQKKQNQTMTLPQIWEEIQYFVSSSPYIKYAVVSIFVLFVLFVILPVKNIPPQKAPASAKSDKQKAILIKGNITITQSAGYMQENALASIEMFFQFPEISMESKRKCKDLFSAGTGDFNILFPLKSKKKPTYFNFKIKGKGFEKSFTKLHLSGEVTLVGNIPRINISL